MAAMGLRRAYSLNSPRGASILRKGAENRLGNRRKGPADPSLAVCVHEREVTT